MSNIGSAVLSIMWSTFRRATISSNRFEVAMAGAMIGIGCYSFAVPEGLVGSRIAPILNLLPFYAFCLVMAGGGTIRLIGLHYGFERIGIWAGRLRSFGAGIGGLIWLQTGVALVLSARDMGMPPSPLVFLYLSLVAAEAVTTARVSADAQGR